MLIASDSLPSVIFRLNVRFRSVILVGFLVLTALVLPPNAKGTTFSDNFPAALPNYAHGGWQGPFGNGSAGRLFPMPNGNGIYMEGTYNGDVWLLRSSPEFSDIDMTAQFSLPTRDNTIADWFSLFVMFQNSTIPPNGPCVNVCPFVTPQSGIWLQYRLGFNKLVLTHFVNGASTFSTNVTLPAVTMNQPHAARATYSAGNLTAYLDGAPLITMLISNLPAGKIGLDVYRVDMILNSINIIGTPVPDFAVGVNPSSATIAPSSSTTAAVTAASLNGFSGTVTLSATTSTASLTTSLSPVNLV